LSPKGPPFMKGETKGKRSRSKGKTSNVVVNCVKELPEELKKMIRSSKLVEDQIDDHFEEFIYAIRYLTEGRYQMNGQIFVSSVKKNGVSESFQQLALEFITDVKEREVKKLYKTLEVNGKGSFGKVVTAKGKVWNAEEGKIVTDIFAIKKIPEKTEQDIANHNNEVACLLELRDHPNIVQIKAAYRLPHEIRIVTEFVEGGTLAQILKIRQLSEPHIFYISQQLLAGIAYMHSKNFVHRDLKSSNIMLSVHGSLKIIDFGFCAELTDGPRVQTVGTAYCMAPEVVKRQSHSFEVDIWSFGIIFLEMYLRHIPVKTKLEALFKAVCGASLQGINPVEINMREEAFALLRQCLIVDPENRASSVELQQNPLIKNASMDLDLETILRTIFVSLQLYDSGI